MPAKRYYLGLLLLSVAFGGCETEEGRHEQMVNLAEVKDDPEGQLQNLNEAIRRSKRDGSLYTRRAIIYLRQGELEKALADANDAVRLTKNDPFSLFVKAQVLRAMHKPEEALPLALQAERNSYQSSSLYILLAELYLERKAYKQAQAYLEKANGLSPADEFVLYYKGRLAEATADTLKAERYYKLALQQAPDFMEPQRELAGIFVAKQDFVAAQPYLKQIEKAAEKDGLVWYYKGVAYQAGQKQDSAVYSFNRAVALNDTLQDAHYRLGQIMYKLGDNEAALEHLKQATGYSNLPKYLLTLAGAYERTGQTAEALQAYQRLVEADPRNTYGYQAISRLKYKLEKPVPDTASVRQDKIELLD